MPLLLLLALLVGCPPGPLADDDDADDDDDSGPSDFAFDFVEVPFDGDWSLATGFAFLPDGTLAVITKEGRVGHVELLDYGTTLLRGEFWLDDVFADEDGGLLSVAVDPSSRTTASSSWASVRR